MGVRAVEQQVLLQVQRNQENHLIFSIGLDLRSRKLYSIQFNSKFFKKCQ